MAASLGDVINQMAEAGIQGILASELVADGKYHRFKPDGQKGSKKSAWYILFEARTRSGRTVWNGAFGKGPDAYTVQFSGREMSVEDRADLAAARAAAKKEAERERQAEAKTAAEKAARLWSLARDEGGSPYLDRKQVRAFGVRFLKSSLVVPVRDAAGDLAGCQFIDAEGGKRFNTGMVKEGRFHLLGDASAAKIIAFSEGYATAASLHMALGWPVVATFDAGNMEPVAAALRPLYPDAQFVFCGDDDRHLRRRLRERCVSLGVPESVEPDGVEHVFHQADEVLRVRARFAPGQEVPKIELTVRRGDGEPRTWSLENAGRKSAAACARKFKGVAVLPAFSAQDADGTDFNDLHLAEGLGVVRSQVLNALQIAVESGGRAKGAQPRKASGGSGDDRKEWALIYPTETAWDGLRRRIVKISAMKLHYGAAAVEGWLSSSSRRTVLDTDVVFDPTEATTDEQVNLFEGWPVKPDGTKSCERLVAHLYDVCDEDDGLFRWVVSWLALPLQRPGAKMRTALIVHGPEGTGKSIFFDVVREIYGQYSRMVTQLQLQSEYTDWLSKMLFCVAEEVVTRQELKHHKGLLKNLVTNPVVNINEKYMPLRTEANHSNFCFLSNEMLPMALDQGDRRYTVIWYEPRRTFSPEYFRALGDEIAAGGAAGLYHWLLQQDLGDFNEHTRPYESRARKNLIELNMPARDRFLMEWKDGLLPDFRFGPARVSDVYQVFRRWCGLKGERFVDNETTVGTMLGRHMHKGVRQGDVWVWDRADNEKGYERVRARQKWRGTVVVPHEWQPPDGEDAAAALFDAVRESQLGVDLFLAGTRAQLAA